jgi:PAS domain S-box-containing protein
MEQNEKSFPVKLLILEDNEIDKKIILSTIENSDLNSTTLIVDTEDAFRQSLLSFKPDVVLSDYLLPDFDGLQALEIQKQILPDTPFVFVTGFLSEETAIDCLKHGAWDYIMKSHIKRLPVSVKNVLALRDERVARRKKEEEITLSEQRYKSLSELTFEGIVIHDKGHVIDCNLSFCKMFGYDRDELINSNVLGKLIHPDDVETTLHSIKEGSSKPYETRAIRKDGSVFFVEQEGKNISYNGKEVRVVAIRDITARKTAMEEIRLSEEKFNKISNAANDAIILIDHEGKVSFWNKAASAMLQYAPGEVLGKNLHELIAPEKYMEAHRAGFNKFLESGEGAAIGQTLELEARRKDGEEIPVELSLSSINIHGKWNAVGIMRDISARKKVESELLAAKKHAQDMNQMKSNFLSTMSHELRTPLNGILGFAEILVESLEDPDYRDYANTIFKSSQRILNTFNLIIDLAVLDANKVTVNKQKVNLIHIIENACESYISEASEKNLYLNQKLAVHEAVVEIDQILVSQVMNNLLNNAIKYTETGGITVSLKKVMVKDTDSFLLTISDTGIGIPEEKASIIYQAFRQADEGYNRPYEGLGLGLYITKQYVDLLEGIIEMISEPGRGTEFRIYIPVNANESLTDSTITNTQQQEKSPNEETARPQILYVEDDIDHQQFLKIFLRDSYDVDVADDGPTALEMVKEKCYDLILMDINLGADMNGMEVVAKIREMPEYADTPIAAVTANALVSQKNAYLDSGCSDYIAKPFRKKKLLSFVKEALARRNNVEV